ncbi:MAG: NAD(P)/FAD-dependent oxidoreductase [Pirellulaceae bacterium]|jgi:cation diffusion facilitator CzcD-associated flavoprotein CzcO|nr:NAD(P)/FAD-dependent oxidoreductase [Pirellulaceae bacterium]
MKSSTPRVLIIGAGISGLCMAIRLKQTQAASFTVLEKSDEVGGTWLDNSYPGSACDVPSFLYSFSFAPKTWARKYAKQSEILDYLRDCADQFGVRDQIRFGAEVANAEYDEKTATWCVTLTSGEQLEADFLIGAVGQLNRPKIPPFKGLDSFEGETFHSARWNHDYDLTGRAVAVIGTAASAIQFVPLVAQQAGRLCIFQRSPNWIMPVNRAVYSRFMQGVFRWVPGVARLNRLSLFLQHEWKIILLKKRSNWNRGLTAWIKRRMRREIPPSLHADLIPSYPAGCKRILLSNDYLDVVQQDHVDLVTERIQEIRSNSIATKEAEYPVDAIIFATGFETAEEICPLQIRGRDGVFLKDQWTPRPRTYLGMLTPGFPNFFTLYGPNTNLGHNSIILMVESQVNYFVRCLRMMADRQMASIEVRPEAVETFDEDLQKGLSKSVWGDPCDNWYKAEDGTITNNWKSSVLSYWWRTRSPDFRQFNVETASADE